MKSGPPPLFLFSRLDNGRAPGKRISSQIAKMIPVLTRSKRTFSANSEYLLLPQFLDSIAIQL